MKILVFDNYDSFTYNLVHIIGELKYLDFEVHRNDCIDLDAVNSFDKIILSPGPGIPEEAGILNELVRFYAPKKSILGVCLGHQAIGEVFGAQLENLSEVYHGVDSEIQLIDDKDYIYKGLPDKIRVGRYHSWIVKNEGLPDELRVSAIDENGQIMGMYHREYDVRGVQFHPESILSEYGMEMIKNWLEK